VSSGATMPARAPNSIDMLQSVIRPSIERASTAPPWYSTMWPAPAPTPTWAMRARIRSLAVTSTAMRPLIRTAIVRGMGWESVWVERTCSTSLVPMPNASAPNAPWVDVCESPQTIVMPGWVRPSCGATTCTMPWSRSPSEKSRMPDSAQLRRSTSTCARASGSAMGSEMPVVGTAWSSIASVRSGRRTRRPAARRPSKACGDETSCTRCRST